MGKVLISTSQMEMINEVVTVESKGILHQVRVIEEQMVINTFIQSDCSCPGCKIQETLHVDEEEDEDDVDDKDKRKNDVDNEVLQLEGVAETEGSKVEEFVEDSVEMVADSTALNAKSAAVLPIQLRLKSKLLPRKILKCMLYPICWLRDILLSTQKLHGELEEAR